MKKEIKGKISISRLLNLANNKSTVRIEIEDDLSGLVISHITMDLNHFAEALMGLAYVNCDIKLFDNQKNLGKKREVKKELIPILHQTPYNRTRSFATLKKAAKFFEINGWKLYEHEFNHHYYKEGKYQATFIRFINSTK